MKKVNLSFVTSSFPEKMIYFYGLHAVLQSNVFGCFAWHVIIM